MYYMFFYGVLGKLYGLGDFCVGVVVDVIE